MKTRDFEITPRREPGSIRRPAPRGPNIGLALLGVACVAGVFALLGLLYHLG